MQPSSMILLFYYLLLQQNDALVTSLCMQLHFTKVRGKYQGKYQVIKKQNHTTNPLEVAIPQKRLIIL